MDDNMKKKLFCLDGDLNPGPLHLLLETRHGSNVALADYIYHRIGN